jgi:transcriptional regulator with XRE-family HTH domain
VEVLTPAQQLMTELRRRSGLSQAELARRAELPRSIVNAYERGKREPGVDSLSQIADAVGMQLTLAPRKRPLDLDRSARILGQVLALAESLPARRRGRLLYPPLRGHTR